MTEGVSLAHYVVLELMFFTTTRDTILSCYCTQKRKKILDHEHVYISASNLAIPHEACARSIAA